MKRPLKRNFSYLAVLLGIGLTLASGVIHGRLSHRWGPPPEILEAAKQLDSLPERFGNWRLQTSVPLDSNALKMLQCVGYINRAYVHDSTGESVTLTVVLGPPGPIWGHKPDGCYSSREYRVVEQRRQVVFPGAAPDEAFWVITFESKDVQASLLRVFYAWSDGTVWSAPGEPRLKYGGRPFLYRMQVAGVPRIDARKEADNPCYEFLESFLPVSRQYLQTEQPSENRDWLATLLK